MLAYFQLWIKIWASGVMTGTSILIDGNAAHPDMERPGRGGVLRVKPG